MKKIKKLWQNKIFKNYFILMISLFISEILFRIIGSISIWNYSVLRIFVGINILALFFGYICSFLPKLAAKIINSIIILVADIYGVAQLGFYNFLGVYTSFQTKSQLSAVTSYILDFLSSFKWYYYLLLLPFIFVVIYYILIDKKISVDLPKKKLTKKNIMLKFIPILTIILLSIFYFGTLKFKFMRNELQAESPYDLFIKPVTPSVVVNEFGYIGFAFLDFKEMVWPGPDNIDSLDININKVQKDVLPEEQTTIDNDLWMSIIDEENNENLNALNKYFISNDISKTNKYTGILENKNLIVIMLESVNDIILNKEYYPNIYKLYQEGFSWDNNYSPRNSCNTMNNEMSGMTGLYTIYNNCTANVYRTNVYFESIFNLFNNAGYSTNSYHDHTEEFYYRKIIHKNMGSNNYYNLYDLGLDGANYSGDWASDEDFMKSYLSMLDKREDNTLFMNWITTVSSHQPYYNNSKFSSVYRDLFPEDYNSELKNYMSKIKVVDNALGILIDGLKERDLLNDTVIVLYGDHYPYAITGDKLNPALPYDTLEDLNIDQVPFIIYNPELKPTKFKEYTSYVNIVPTIANLFGLKYDSRLYMGMDILSDEYTSMVVFADGSWKNENAFFNASSSKINYYTDKTYTDEEILEINTKISLKLKMSSLAIRSNYFSYLNKKLTSLEETVDPASE